MRHVLCFSLLFAIACASKNPGTGAAASPGEPLPPGSGSGQSAASAPGAAGDGGTQPPEPPPGASLPEVKVKSVGMHIGGGSNDAARKEPFQRALARKFPDLLACYRLIAEPKSGTFGVDLHIPKGGGKPRVEQPRTALPGEEFRECVVHAFESTEFEPTKVPTVISYSVRFSVGSQD